METSMDERREQALAALNDLIGLMGDCAMPETAQFLAMAKLQFQIEFNEISDMEFRALCNVLDGKVKMPRAGLRARPGLPRLRRDGDLRGMRRAWQRPDRTDSSRGSRNRAKQ